MKKESQKIKTSPTDYREEYDQMLIDHSSKGLSFASFGAQANVSEQTLYNWLKKFPSFAKAKELADQKRLEFWEDLGVKLATGELKGSSAVYIHQLCNRFPKHYQNRVTAEVNHTVSADGLLDVLKSMGQKQLPEKTPVEAEYKIVDEEKEKEPTDFRRLKRPPNSIFPD